MPVTYDNFQVDSFTGTNFKGNPACVVPLTHWLPDELMKTIARENAVAETAFFIPRNAGYNLRWFTPDIEMDLCGHATLAVAFVLKTFLDHQGDIMEFNTASGRLTVTVKEDLFILDFPSRPPVAAALPAEIREALSIQPREVWKSRDFILVYRNEAEIRELIVSKEQLDQINLDPGGVVVTAQGNDCDFVSRYFTPQASILEDPVTGSAHCSLVPYWSHRLGRGSLHAMQLSDRGGELFVEDSGDRICIGGRAKAYARRTIVMP
jgi:PhzF family phenazine biosynthesis protein